MQLRANDLLYSNGYEYLHPGYCGPIYVNQIWSEDMSEGSYVDKYWDNGCVAYGPKRMIKAEIECESPEILNSILGQIRNIQETMIKVFSDEIAKCYMDSIRYKLKHKVLHKC